MTARVIHILFNGFNRLGRISPNSISKTPIPPNTTEDDLPIKNNTMPTSKRTVPTVNPNLRKVVLSSFIFLISSLKIIINQVRILFSNQHLFLMEPDPSYQK